MYSRSTNVYQIVLTLSAVMVFSGSVESSRNGTKEYTSELLERNLLERYKRIKRSIDQLDNFDRFSGLEDSDFSTFPSYDTSLMQETLNEFNHFRNIPVTWIPLGWRVAKRMLNTPKQIYTSGKDYFDFGMNLVRDMIDSSGVASNNPQDSKGPPVTVVTVTFPVVPNSPVQSNSVMPSTQTYQFSPLDSSIYPLNTASFSSGPITPSNPAPVPFEQIPPSSTTQTPLSFDLLSSPPIPKPPIPVAETTYAPVLTDTDPSSFGTFATTPSNSVPSNPIKSSPTTIESLPPFSPGLTATSPLPGSIDPIVSSPNSLEPSIPSSAAPALPDMASPTPGTYSPTLLPRSPYSETPLDPILSTSATLSPTSLNTASHIFPIPTHTPMPRASIDFGTPSPSLPNSDSSISPISSWKVPSDTFPSNPSTFSPVLRNAVPPIPSKVTHAPTHTAPLTPDTPLPVLSNLDSSTTVVPSSEVPFHPSPLTSAVPSSEVPLNSALPTPATHPEVLPSAILSISHITTQPTFPPASVIPEISSPDLLSSNPLTSAAPPILSSEVPLDPNPLISPTLLNAVPPTLPTPTHASLPTTPLTPDPTVLSNLESRTSVVPSLEIPVDPNPPDSVAYSFLTTSLNTAPAPEPTLASFPTTPLTADVPSPILSNRNPQTSTVPFSEVPLDTVPSNPATHVPVLLNSVTSIPPTLTHASVPSASTIPDVSSAILSDPTSPTPLEPSPGTIESVTPTPTVAQTVSSPTIAIIPDSPSTISSESTPLTPVESLPATLESVTPTPPTPESVSSLPVTMAPDSPSPISSISDPQTPLESSPDTLESVSSISTVAETVSSSSVAITPDSSLTISSEPIPLTPIESVTPTPPTPESVSSPPVAVVPDSHSPILSDPVPVTRAVSSPDTLESVTLFVSPPDPIYSSSSESMIPDSSSSLVSDLDPLTPTPSSELSESILPSTPEPPLSSESASIPVITSPISLIPATPPAHELLSSPSSPVPSIPFQSGSETGPQVEAPPVNGGIFDESADDKINMLTGHQTSEDEVALPLTLEELIFHRKEHLKSKMKQLRSDAPNQAVQYMKRCCIIGDETCDSPISISNLHENCT